VIPPNRPGLPWSPRVRGYTFYGRYLPGPTGADNREPLASVWGTRHLDIDGGARLVVWRDAKAPALNLNAGFTCGLCAQGAGPPSWCPLAEDQVVCWDEAEDAVELCTPFISGGIPIDRPCPFDLESQLVTVGAGNFTPPVANGWCFLNLSTNSPGALPSEEVSQSHVSALFSALGRYSVGLAATEIASACGRGVICDDPFGSCLGKSVGEACDFVVDGTCIDPTRITGDLGEIPPP
jgi:hypothetical protein